MADLTDTGFWQRFWGRVTGRARLEDSQRALPFESHTTPSGSTEGPDSSLKLSAVWACVRLRSQTIASMPLHLRAEVTSLAQQHRRYRLLHSSPNTDMTASELSETLNASMDMQENAIVLTEWNGRRVVSQKPLNTEKVVDGRSGSGELTYEYTK